MKPLLKKYLVILLGMFLLSILISNLLPLPVKRSLIFPYFLIFFIVPDCINAVNIKLWLKLFIVIVIAGSSILFVYLIGEPVTTHLFLFSVIIVASLVLKLMRQKNLFGKPID